MKSGPAHNLPDIRDGLTRIQRIILYCQLQLQNERAGRNVPTAMLYGRVLEYIDTSMDEMQQAIAIPGDNKITAPAFCRFSQKTTV